jgi:hypothetical protein
VGGGLDQRAFLSSKIVAGGTGIDISETPGQTTVAVDPAIFNFKAQPLFGTWNASNGVSAAAGATQYFALNSITGTTTESRMAVPVPVAGTLSAWYLRTVSNQPSDNSMTCSVRVNLATPANTLSITIPANQTPGVLSDLVHSVHVNTGDTWDIMCVNASGSTSAYMTLVSFKFLPD